MNEGGAQLANELDKAWEEELNNPGAMALYENWVMLKISLVMIFLLFNNTLNIFFSAVPLLWSW